MRVRVAHAWEAEHYHEKADFKDVEMTVLIRKVKNPIEEGRGIAVHYLFHQPDDKERIWACWQRLLEAVIDANPDAVKMIWDKKHPDKPLDNITDGGIIIPK